MYTPPTGAATSAATGYAAVRSNLVSAGAEPPNATCWLPYRFVGPYGGAKPEDRVALDGKRFNDGMGANMQYWNFVRAQAAMEALDRAGVQDPRHVIPKSSVAEASATVMARTGNGTYASAGYAQLGYDKYSPYAPVHSTGANLGVSAMPGTPIAAFPSGVVLVSPVPLGVSPVSLAATGAQGTALAAAVPSTTGTLAPLGVDIWTQLAVNNETLPGVSLFAVPNYPGDIANLHVTGTGILDAVQAGNIQTAEQMTWSAQANWNSATSSSAPGTGNLFPTNVINPTTGGYGPTVYPSPGGSSTYAPAPSPAWSGGTSIPAARAAAVPAYAFGTPAGSSNPWTIPSAVASLPGSSVATAVACPSCVGWR